MPRLHSGRRLAPAAVGAGPNVGAAAIASAPKTGTIITPEQTGYQDDDANGWTGTRTSRS